MHFKIKPKDPASSITHFIAMIGTILITGPLIMRTLTPTHALALTIFIASMIVLYAASTTYHTFDISEKWNTILRKIDHCAIFLLIAGSYTPICLIALNERTGLKLFAIIWITAIVGITLKLVWIHGPAWLSSAIYIGMGWTCLLAFAPIFHALPRAAFVWLTAGGVIYTIGGIIYALKLPLFNARFKNFDSHALFHVFVMAGSFCHLIMMYGYVAVMPI